MTNLKINGVTLHETWQNLKKQVLNDNNYEYPNSTATKMLIALVEASVQEPYNRIMLLNQQLGTNGAMLVSMPFMYAEPTLLCQIDMIFNMAKMQLQQLTNVEQENILYQKMEVVDN